MRFAFNVLKASLSARYKKKKTYLFAVFCARCKILKLYREKHRTMTYVLTTIMIHNRI